MLLERGCGGRIAQVGRGGDPQVPADPAAGRMPLYGGDHLGCKLLGLREPDGEQARQEAVPLRSVARAADRGEVGGQSTSNLAGSPSTCTSCCSFAGVRDRGMSWSISMSSNNLGWLQA
ncbi:hypothetical protein [Dactylosporangium sp. NPDC048998]|uniref:hypothetical protein n=1 Tax=Dactylosporangium sp. NPDC048998 TaxID=3363976 RepID=UPI003717CF5C